MNDAIFGKGLLNIKYEFSFSVRLMSETFLILKRTERDFMKINVNLHVGHPLILSDFNESGLSRRIFEKQ